MSKTITEQIEDLENENRHLKELQTSFEKMVKVWYGTDAKTIQKLLENAEQPTDDFCRKIISYFGLKTQNDLTDFITVFCTKSSIDFFKKNRDKTNHEEHE